MCLRRPLPSNRGTGPGRDRVRPHQTGATARRAPRTPPFEQHDKQGGIKAVHRETLLPHTGYSRWTPPRRSRSTSTAHSSHPWILRVLKLPDPSPENGIEARFVAGRRKCTGDTRGTEPLAQGRSVRSQRGGPGLGPFPTPGPIVPGAHCRQEDRSDDRDGDKQPTVTPACTANPMTTGRVNVPIRVTNVVAEKPIARSPSLVVEVMSIFEPAGPNAMPAPCSTKWPDQPDRGVETPTSRMPTIPKMFPITTGTTKPTRLNRGRTAH